MKYVVHCYAVVRVPVEVTADTPQDAARIGQDLAMVRMSESVTHAAEYAGEMQTFSVVDPVLDDGTVDIASAVDVDTAESPTDAATR